MKRPKGFFCPNCGVRLETIRVIRSAPGIVDRRRACTKCDYRVTTTERPASPVAPPHG